MMLDWVQLQNAKPQSIFEDKHEVYAKFDIFERFKIFRDPPPPPPPLPHPPGSTFTAKPCFWSSRHSRITSKSYGNVRHKRQALRRCRISRQKGHRLRIFWLGSKNCIRGPFRCLRASLQHFCHFENFNTQTSPKPEPKVQYRLSPNLWCDERRGPFSIQRLWDLAKSSVYWIPAGPK